jgi:hypothetical protein
VDGVHRALTKGMLRVMRLVSRVERLVSSGKKCGVAGDERDVVERSVLHRGTVS